MKRVNEGTLLRAVLIPALIGIISSFVAGQFGYKNVETWEHWSFYAMMMVPYIIGQVV